MLLKKRGGFRDSRCSYMEEKWKGELRWDLRLSLHKLNYSYRSEWQEWSFAPAAALLLSPLAFSFNSLYDSHISLSPSLSFSLSFLFSFLSLFHSKKQNWKTGWESWSVCALYVPALLGISGAAAKNNLHQTPDMLSMSFCRNAVRSEESGRESCYWEDD